jgi:nucleoside-diphosphate-sugar epimerase
MAERDLVVIFGGAGYIGSHLTRLLLEQDYAVRVYDNFLYGRQGLDLLNDHPKRANLEIIEDDICNTRAVYSSTKDAYAVVLLAALIGHRVRDTKWKDLRTVNLLANSVVLDAAIEHGAERFVFASTNSVYGIQEGVMYETTIPQPSSLYARLKLRMEERVIRAKRSNFHPTSLRIATCHGYSPRMRFDLIANLLIRDAFCKQKITIENGEQWRAQIHVEDAARAFVSCLKAHSNLISGEIFNVGAASQNLQINQIANAIRTIIPELDVEILETEPDLVDYRLSCSKIEKLLDFQTAWSIENSLTEIRDKLAGDYFLDPYSMQFSNS